MRNSDVFNEFLKIAQKKGLISSDDEAQHNDKPWKPEHTEKNITTNRVSGLSIEQIGKLYHVKPPMPKEMEYQYNIMEDAHPEPVVISPSYDKLNGLVESEIEGQNIRARIVMKEPDGHLIQRKYAQQLILSLVRIANDLDNRNQNQLCKLADTCLMQASQLTAGKKVLYKVAILPFLVGSAVMALGAFYLKQHLPFHSDGFSTDYQKAISEIDDLLNSNSNMEVGYDYSPAFLQIVSKLKTDLGTLDETVQKVMPLIERVQIPREAGELQQVLQQDTTQDAIQAVKELKEVWSNLLPEINGVITDFSSEQFKQHAITHKGVLTSWVDAWGLHGGASLVADDFDDVKHALQALKQDINNIGKTLVGAERFKQSAQQQIQQSQQEAEKTFEPEEDAKSIMEEAEKAG